MLINNFFKDWVVFDGKLDRTIQWIKDGDRDCQVVETEQNQTIIK